MLATILQHDARKATNNGMNAEPPKTRVLIFRSLRRLGDRCRYLAWQMMGVPPSLIATLNSTFRRPDEQLSQRYWS